MKRQRHKVKTTTAGHCTFMYLNRPGESSTVSNGSQRNAGAVVTLSLIFVYPKQKAPQTNLPEVTTQLTFKFISLQCRGVRIQSIRQPLIKESRGPGMFSGSAGSGGGSWPLRSSTFWRALKFLLSQSGIFLYPDGILRRIVVYLPKKNTQKCF